MSRAASFEERARAKLVFAEIYKKLGCERSLSEAGTLWAEKILDRAACGAKLEPIQIQMAARALARQDPDWESKLEAVRERAAIQCEHLPV